MASSANGTTRNAPTSASVGGSATGNAHNVQMIPAPAYGIVSAWTRLFKLALTDWVNDFLFATDGATCAAQLLSPLQATYAQPMTATAAETGDVIAAHWLLLPTYSVANITVGHVVVEELSGVRDLRKYCLDDDTGAMLCIGTARDTMEVEHVRFNTPFSSTRTYCHFAPELRTYLRSCKSKAFVDDNTVRAALQVCMILHERRASCIQCGARALDVSTRAVNGPSAAVPPTTFDPCSCRFHFKRARHPLDFENTARNTVPLLGDFRGQGRTLVFQHGRVLNVHPTLTELCVRAGGAAGTFEKLRSWAVQMYYGEGKPNPLRLEMPPVGNVDLEAEMLADSFLKLDTEPSVQATDVKAQANITNQSIVSGQPPLEELNLKLNIPPPSPTLIPVVPAAKIQAIATSMPLASTWNTSRANVQQPVVPVHIPVPTANGGDGLVAGNRVPLLHSQVGALPMSTATLPQPVAVVPSLPGGSLLVQKRAWTSIAPSAVPPVAGEKYSSLERRKIMKREAAARSNAKRREVVALQRQVKKVQRKITELRAREQKLIEENRRLRALVDKTACG